jgi:hypothetical protein
MCKHAGVAQVGQDCRASAEKVSRLESLARSSQDLGLGFMTVDGFNANNSIIEFFVLVRLEVMLEFGLGDTGAQYQKFRGTFDFARDAVAKLSELSLVMGARMFRLENLGFHSGRLKAKDFGVFVVNQYSHRHHLCPLLVHLRA